MVASITDLPLDRQDDAILHPAENFMRICEEKGDYSFIYCTAPPVATYWEELGDQPRINYNQFFLGFLLMSRVIWMLNSNAPSTG